ncbi:MAG: HEAT repeat domain-containing protein [Armatimonadetes bacterium]|nr:HEAT repeat domain-containing protein [Armatimonadota bacterium]
MKPAILALCLGIPALWAADDDPYEQLKGFDSQNRTALNAVVAQVRAANGDAAKLAEVETRLVPVLHDAAATLAAKQEACRILLEIGTGRCVPALAAMLSDPKLADVARYALERNADPAAGDALLAALGTAKGAALSGIVNSVGNRRDARAVPALLPLLTDPDATLAEAAIVAVGRIGAPEGLAALTKLTVRGPAVCQAVVMCAERLGGKAAEDAYLLLCDPSVPGTGWAAALRGLAAMKSSKALEQTIRAVQVEDPYLRRNAARLAATLPDPATVARFTAICPGLPADVQVVVVAALADRGDKAAAPLAIELLTATDTGVRQAAIRAAATLGGASAVAPLGELAGRGDRGDKQLVREVLGRMPGKDAAAKILEQSQKAAPAVRIELMQVLVDREMREAVPSLMAAAKETDTGVATAAWKALARLAPPERHDALVGMLLAATDDDVRAAAGDAVVESARRVGNRDKASAALLAGLAGVPAAARQQLLGPLAAIGGPKALAELTRAAGSADAEEKRAAIKAIADQWQDSSALEVLMGVVKSDAPTGMRVLALRGYLRLVSQDGAMKADDKVARLAEAMASAPRLEEKKQVLSALRDCRCEAAVAIAARYLDDAELGQDAGDAVVYLATAQRRDNQRLPAVKGSAARLALSTVLSKRGKGLPAPWLGDEVGDVNPPGTAAFDGGKITIKAAGADIWGAADGCYFVSQPLTGDGSITARVVSVEAVNEWTKAGVMVRDGVNADAAHGMMCITPANGGSFQRRPAAKGESTCNQLPAKAPYWVKIERKGDVVTASMSEDGQAWTKVGEETIKMGREVLVGLAVTSHDAGRPAEAVFDSVLVSR